jgi:hypothetical protein
MHVVLFGIGIVHAILGEVYYLIFGGAGGFHSSLDCS